jgi:hypothetical protein
MVWLVDAIVSEKHIVSVCRLEMMSAGLAVICLEFQSVRRFEITRR